MKIDFRKIEVKDIEGNNSTVDIAKELGNAIYNNTTDLGELEFAQEVYKHGEVEVDSEKAEIIRKYMEVGRFFACIKKGVFTMKNKKIMATKILSEKTRTTQVEAIAKEGEYEYQTTYSYNENGITRLQCCIIQKAKTDLGEQTVHAGYMALEGDSKSMNFPTGIDMVPHISMFENILREVNAGLTK